MTPCSSLIDAFVSSGYKLYPYGAPDKIAKHAAELAYQAGADAELEHCIHWIAEVWDSSAFPGAQLRTARRPPTLKQQALEQLNSLHADLKRHGMGTNTDTIRRALEALDD